MGNKPIFLPSMGNLWHKKLILHLNLPIGFLQLGDFFATQKCSILVTHRFSMYAWVTCGEKEIKRSRDLLSPIAPKLYSYGLTLMGYKYNSK